MASLLLDSTKAGTSIRCHDVTAVGGLHSRDSVGGGVDIESSYVAVFSNVDSGENNPYFSLNNLNNGALKSFTQINTTNDTVGNDDKPQMTFYLQDRNAGSPGITRAKIQMFANAGGAGGVVLSSENNTQLTVGNTGVFVSNAGGTLPIKVPQIVSGKATILPATNSITVNIPGMTASSEAVVCVNAVSTGAGYGLPAAVCSTNTLTLYNMNPADSNPINTLGPLPLSYIATL